MSAKRSPLPVSDERAALKIADRFGDDVHPAREEHSKAILALVDRAWSDGQDEGLDDAAVEAMRLLCKCQIGMIAPGPHDRGCLGEALADAIRALPRKVLA